MSGVSGSTSSSNTSVVSGGYLAEDPGDGFATDVTPAWGEHLPAWADTLIALLSAGQMWPEGSESTQWRLRTLWHELAQGLDSHVEEGVPVIDRTLQKWDAPPTDNSVANLESLYSPDSGVPVLRENASAYAAKLGNFALETQYSKLSINVAFWISLIAISIGLVAVFFTGGMAARLIVLIAKKTRWDIDTILRRLVAAAGRSAGARAILPAAQRVATTAAAGGSARTILSSVGRKAVVAEVVEEGAEEAVIETKAQKDQIGLGTRDRYDSRRIIDATLGGAVGGIVGMKAAPRVSRMFGGSTASRGFPGRTLQGITQAGVVNVIASAAGGMVVGLGHGRLVLPTVEGGIGAFAGAAGRYGSLSPFNVQVLQAASTPAATFRSGLAASFASYDANTTNLATAATPPDPASSESSPSGASPAGTPPTGGGPTVAGGAQSTNSQATPGGQAAPSKPAPAAPAAAMQGAPAGSTSAGQAASGPSAQTGQTGSNPSGPGTAAQGSQTGAAQGGQSSQAGSPQSRQTGAAQGEQAASGPSVQAGQTGSNPSGPGTAAQGSQTGAAQGGQGSQAGAASVGQGVPDPSAQTAQTAPDPSASAAQGSQAGAASVGQGVPDPSTQGASPQGAGPVSATTTQGQTTPQSVAGPQAAQGATGPTTKTELAESAMADVMGKLGLDALLVEGGHVRLSRADGSVVHLPAATLRIVRERLETRAGDGAGPHRLRAEAAAWLGIEVARADGRPALEGAIQGLHFLAEAAPETGAAALRVATEIVLDNPNGLDQSELTEGARQLVAEANKANEPASAPADEYAALRPGRQVGAAEEIVRKADELVAELAGTASNPAGPGTSSRPSAISDLAGRVKELTESLAAAESALKERRQSRARSAGKAMKGAKEALAKVEAAEKAERDGKPLDGERDSEAPKRRHEARAQAKADLEAAARDLRIAATYEQARAQAEAARSALAATSAALGRLTAHQRTSLAGPLAARVARLAHEAESQLVEYHKAMREAMPSTAMLPAGLPVGPLPYMTKLTEKVNEALAAKGSDYRYTVAELESVLETEFGQMLSPDGAVVRVRGVELRVKLQVSDLVEVLRSKGWTVSEAMTGRFIQGSHGVSVSGGRSNGWSGDVNVPGLLGTLVKALPVENGFRQVVEQVGPRVILGGGGGRSRGESTSMSFAGFVRNGPVLDNRGESSEFNGVGEYEFEVVAPGETGGRSVVRVVDGSAGDATRVEMVVSHAHIEHGPEETAQLTFEPGKAPPLPKSAPIDVEGLEGVLEKFRAELLSQSPDLARNSLAQEQIRTFIVGKTPAQLAELVNSPQGLRQTISVPGHPELTIVLKGRLKYESTPDGRVRLAAQVDGTASSKQLGEDVGVAQSVASVGQGANRSWNVNGAAGAKFSGEMLAELNHRFKNLAAKVSGSGSRSGSESVGLNAGGAAITPIVRRKSGRNQVNTFEVELEVEGTLHDKGKNKPLPPISDTIKATVQIAQNVAAAAGLPFDEQAIVRDDSGAERRHPDGSLMLQDDSVPEAPPGRKGEMTWQGDGPGQVRGIGFGHAELKSDIAAFQRTVAAYLRKNGMLPKLDGNGEQNPVFSSDPVERASQEAMMDVIENQLKDWVETHYNQLVQGGKYLYFTHERTGQPPEHLTLHLQLGRKWQTRSYVSYTDAKTVVTLYIGSDTSGSSSGESTSWEAGVRPGVEYKSGDEETTASAGAGYTGGKGRNTSENKSGTANGVALIEGLGGLTAEIGETDTLTVTHVKGDGQVHEVASADVRVEQAIPSDLLPEDGISQSTATIPTTEELMAETAQLALDLGKNADLLINKISEKTGIRPGTPEFQVLAEALSVDNLMGHPEFLHSDYEIEIVVDTEGFGKRSWSVSLRGHLGESRIVTGGKWLTSLIGLDLTSATTSVGEQTSHAVNASASGGTSQAENPKIGAGADGSHSWNHGTSESTTPITGAEGLPIDVSRKLMLAAELSTTVVISEVGTDNVETITTTGGTYQYSKPERDALSLYAQGKLPLALDRVSDVVEAFMHGKLEIERATQAALVQRYLHDLKVARSSGDPLPELAARHTPPALFNRLMESFGNQDESLRRETDPGRGLARLFAKERDRAANPELAELPEGLRRRMGQSWPEKIVLRTQNGAEIDVYNAILKAVEAYAPGALASNPALRRRLFGDFAGRRWWGKIVNMLGANGHAQSQPVRDAGRIPIRLQMDLGDGPVEVTGRLSDLLLIMQGYTYRNKSVSASAGTSRGGGVSPGGSVGHPDASFDPSGAAEAGQSGSRSVTNSEQWNELERSASFEGMAKVRHGVGVTITVGEDLGAEPAAGEQGKHGEARRPVVVELQGEMTRLVAQEMVGATEGTRVPDPRPFTLPPSYKVDSLQADGLLTAVQNLLADSKLFGAKAARKARATLEQNLNDMQKAANFRQMLQEDGGLLVRVPHPDKPGTVVDVTVRARPGDVHVTVAGRENTEIGRVRRIQHVSEVATNQGLRFSLRGALGIIGLKVGRFFGWTASVRTSVSNGIRVERSVFKRGTAASTEVPLVFDLAAELRTVKASGAKAPKLRIEVPGAATGKADLTVFEQELSEAQARRGDEGRRRWGWNLGDPEVTRTTGTTERPGWRARWRSGPPAATPPSLDLDTLTTQAMEIAQTEGKAGSGVTPDVLRQGIVEMAEGSLSGRWTRGTPILLTVNATAPGQMGPVTQARLLARGLRTDVLIELREPDGTMRHYRATRKGKLYSEVPDGGFASAFAPLHPDLVTLADQAGVDLRVLHNRSPEEGDFAKRVSEALAATPSAATAATQSPAAPSAATAAAPSAATQSPAGPGAPQQPSTARPSGSTFQPGATASAPARAASAPSQGVIRRFLLAPLTGTRSEYVSARYNEYRHLAERWQKADTASRSLEQQLSAPGQGRTALEEQIDALAKRRDALAQQLNKVEEDLRERGQAPPVPPWETGPQTVPGPGGALASLLNRSDGETVAPSHWESQFWDRMRRLSNTTGLPPEEEPCLCPPGGPCVCGRRPQVPGPRSGTPSPSPSPASPSPSPSPSPSGASPSAQPSQPEKPSQLENSLSADGRTVTTRPDSTLWEIAEEAYGDGRYWKDIWERNREKIGSDPGALPADLELVVPDRPKSR
ncbi:LysM peptidoglycan-binding domain-containing protein [Streptosporangium roseum]|uniref:LysM peptidoglycan-binding domain-containing protein n=1 Tax=Streptosporangium roseum TaxID=2001 RepID=UPI00331FB95C